MNENFRTKPAKFLSCFFLTLLILCLPAPTFSQSKPTPPTGMIFIPEGYFPMGNSSGKEDEKPLHFVYTRAFFIDKHEVSNAEYMKFIGATGHAKPTFHLILPLALRSSGSLISRFWLTLKFGWKVELAVGLQRKWDTWEGAHVTQKTQDKNQSAEERS